MSQLKIQFINAGVGDCTLITDLVSNKKILIDSGPSKGVGRLTVTSVLTRILGGNKDIDLAILTHNDDDHIGGFTGLITNNIVKINKIIFNTVAELEDDQFVDSGKASYRQDLNLYKTVKDTNIDIESLVVHEGSLNTIELGDITLRFISPNISKMSKLKSWAIREEKVAVKKEEERLAKSKKASKNVNYTCLDDALDAINLEDTFEPDTREPNGSSFAFILEYGDNRLLFLGDCHMDIVEAYLADQDKPQIFDLVKLSHHSSEHNNSQEFFNQIDCENFVVCSDGYNTHGHPSMKTIARLTKRFPESFIHFTSESDRIKTFTQSFEDRCHFPLDNALEFTYDLSK
ncbi:beta-lactamase domain protein [Psychromonas ingrahamii 37]|uniref:Beta-lactamase domain protein n=1 Tax=Psychromonas ingrahamii (strain DSM 17664 / CCUG 51855 / 37) TaxID=357804 RepID=A1SZ96_PSYIN|nr:MBL fold metallo-hydrolase [Psychromonas ingrahamii]ABM04811.1 beta-lactamase domain protein [Psychromonas ingrahamii 37]